MRGMHRFIIINLALFVALGYPAASSAVGFGAPTLYPVGTSPNDVVVGDFYGDGKMDLAVAEYMSGTVSILRGNGDGTFQAAVTSSVGPFPFQLIAGDFNGDHKLDLIVLSQGNSSTAGAINVLLGNGDGTFQAPASVQLPAGLSPVSAAAADFNGDGILDLIVSDTTRAVMSVFFGNANGTFQTAKAFPLPFGVNGSFVVADFNNDLKPDLAIVGTGSIHIFLGNGDGTFQAPTAVNVTFLARGVQAADINHDGKVDLVVVSEQFTSGGCPGSRCTTQTTDHLSLFLGNGDGSFQAEQVVATASSVRSFFRTSGSTISGPALIADFNGDGKLDLGYQLLPAAFRRMASSSLKVILGKGDGTFSPVVVTTPITFVRAVADLNGDKNSDLVISETGSIANNIGVLLNTSPTTGADLGIIAAGGGPNPVGIATNLTYTANLLNQGPQDATNVTFTDTLPNGVNFVSATATQGSCIQSHLVVTCNLGGLVSASSTQVTVIVTPTAPGTLTNQMSVTATEPDMVLANNTATQSTTVVPIFTLTVAKTGNGSGVVQAAPAGIDATISCGNTCSAKYLSGTSVNISPGPDSSSVLASWSGACSGNSNPCTITMDSDKSVTANLVLGVALSVTLAGTGSGTVTSNSGGIGCGAAGGACSTLYPPGTSVSLTAAPAGGSTFVSWSGACAGTDPTTCNVTMNSAQSVTATFNPPPDFSITPAAATLALHPNSTGTDVLTFAAQAGFSGVISLSCSVAGPSAMASCGLSPTSVTPGATPVMSTLTITVPGLSARLTPSNEGQRSGPLYAIFLPLPALALIGFGFASSKSNDRRRALWLLCCLTLAFIALQVGCGAVGSGPPPPTVQTYMVTVTATPTSGVAHTTSITVTVQ